MQQAMVGFVAAPPPVAWSTSCSPPPSPSWGNMFYGGARLDSEIATHDEYINNFDDTQQSGDDVLFQELEGADISSNVVMNDLLSDVACFNISTDITAPPPPPPPPSPVSVLLPLPLYVSSGCASTGSASTGKLSNEDKKRKIAMNRKPVVYKCPIKAAMVAKRNKDGAQRSRTKKLVLDKARDEDLQYFKQKNDELLRVNEQLEIAMASMALNHAAEVAAVHAHFAMV